MLKEFRSAQRWTKMVVVLMWGSMLLGKTSGFLGLALGFLLLFDPRVLWNRWYAALTQPGDPLGGLAAWAILVSLVYGFGELIYGVLLGLSVCHRTSDSSLQHLPDLCVSGDLGRRPPQQSDSRIRTVCGVVHGDLHSSLFPLIQ